MKRLLVCAVVVLSMCLPATAKARGPCLETRYRVGRSTPPAEIVRRERRLIACAFRWVGLASQVPKALEVARRESGYYPWARNPYSGTAGVFQHMPRFWPGRVRAYLGHLGFPSFPRVGPFNDRANIFAAAMLVRQVGWSPWTTA